MTWIAVALLLALPLGAHAMTQDLFRGEREAPAEKVESGLPIHAVTLPDASPEKVEAGPAPQDPKGGKCTAKVGSDASGGACPGQVDEPGPSALLVLPALALLATRRNPFARGAPTR